jgi:hypothetical protein
MQGQGKSRRWRDGDCRRHKASARVFCALARFRMRRGSDGAGIAGSCASAVTERSGSSLPRQQIRAAHRRPASHSMTRTRKTRFSGFGEGRKEPLLCPPASLPPWKGRHDNGIFH